MAGIIKKYYEDKDIIVSSAAIPAASTDLTDTADITYNADTDVSGNGWVLDEDTLVSDSATKLATQQSIKAYVDANAGGLDSDGVFMSIYNNTGALIPGRDTTAPNQIGILSGSTVQDTSGSTVHADELGHYFQHNSTTTTGNDCFISTNSALYPIARMDTAPLLIGAIKLLTLTDVRFFFGFSEPSAASGLDNADIIPKKAFGIQFSSNRGDTKFQAIESNGSTQDNNEIDHTAQADKYYYFIVDVQTGGTSVKVSIIDEDGAQLGSTQTLNTKIPASTDTLIFTIMSENLNASNVGHKIYFISCTNRINRVTTLPS